jgi:hypothetical protein
LSETTGAAPLFTDRADGAINPEQALVAWTTKAERYQQPSSIAVAERKGERWTRRPDFWNTNQEITDLHVGLTNEHSAAIAWVEREGGRSIIRVSARPSDGSWQEGNVLYESPGSVYDLQVAFSSPDTAVLVWTNSYETSTMEETL